mmetsp:Transcript_19921/g.48472  ORF Transcript_19921/g.48472 Transcript_19921/m.48472 type:complete len:325 (-) Transcript_19921:439-1413(-)
MLSIPVELESVSLHGFFGLDGNGVFIALFLLLLPSDHLRLPKLVLSKLAACHALLLLFFLLCCIEMVAPFFPHLRPFHLLRPVLVALVSLAINLVPPRLINVLHHGFQLHLLLNSFLLVQVLLFEHLRLHPSVLIVTKLVQALGLHVDHLLAFSLLSRKHISLLLTPQLEHLLLLLRVLFDLLLFALLSQSVFLSDLLQVLIRFLSFHKRLLRLSSLLHGQLLLLFQVFMGLSCKHFTFQDALFNLPQPFVHRLVELLLLCSSEFGIATSLLLFLSQLSFQHLAVVLLVHLQIPLLADVFQSGELILQLHLRIALSQHVGEHHL